MRLIVLVGSLAVLCACPGQENTCIVQCDGGTGGGATGTGGGSGGSGGSGGGTATGGGTGGACSESWVCQPWLAAQPRDGGAVRTCVDANGCGTTAQKPTTSAALPALDLPFFQCQVQPVLARSCAMVGCHGVLNPQQRPFQVLARARQRNDEIIMYNQSNAGCLQSGTVAININVVGTGTASCNAKARLSANEWAISFDSARAQAVGLSSPDSTELLQQPLRGSTFAHAGIKLWGSTADPDYVTVRSWLNGMTAAATCNNATNN